MERGTHQELLALNGRYAAMWKKHCRAERAAKQAHDATRKAKELLSRAKISRPDEISDGYNSMLSSTILPTGRRSPTVTAADAHDTASISSDAGSTSSGSEGTLQDEGCDEHRRRDQSHTKSDRRDGSCRPPLYSFPSQSTASPSTDAPRSP